LTSFQKQKLNQEIDFIDITKKIIIILSAILVPALIAYLAIILVKSLD
jgi:hypothetical protein